MQSYDAIVDVALPRGGYAVHIGRGLLSRACALLKGRWRDRRACIVTDTNVGPLYADRLAEALCAGGIAPHVVTIPPGESSKSLAQAARLYDELALCRHERGEPIFALGGGVVGDLAGFVAATWMRGVPLVQVPTSLEADIDASVGGKTGVNHASGKNIIGAFHQPAMVLIDVDCLATLSDRDYTAALAESVKHAIISGDDFLRWHEGHIEAILSRDPHTLLEFIRRNCEVKARVVVADERECDSSGVGRAALNLGHTVGHAIEAESAYEMTHGEAIGLGLIVELDLAVRHARLSDADRTRVERLLSALGHAGKLKETMSSEALVSRMRIDKKALLGGIRFVVPPRLGLIEWLSVADDSSIKQAFLRIRP